MSPFSIFRECFIPIIIGMLFGALMGVWVSGSIVGAVVGMAVGAGGGFACARAHRFILMRYLLGVVYWDLGPSPEKRAVILAMVREHEKKEQPPFRPRRATYLHKIARADDVKAINRHFQRAAAPYPGLLAPYLAWFRNPPYMAGEFKVWQHPEEIEARDSFGSSPLHYAARFHAPSAAESLILHGANIEARNKEAATPLHLAAFSGAESVVDILIKHGADINVRNELAETPLDLAMKAKNREVTSQLLNYGAENGAGSDLDDLRAAREDHEEELSSLWERSMER